MGKPMIYAIVTSQANMAKLDRYKEITRKLSLVSGRHRATRRARWQRKARRSSTSTADCTRASARRRSTSSSSRTTCVTGEDANTRLMRDNVIAILVFANPDGMDLLAEWYQSNLGTPYEVGPMPWLYHKYSGHDNNRDSYMTNLVETKNITRLVNQEWFPEILYNQHQTGPFPTRIFVPPQAEPTNPNIHPLILRWQNLVGTAMAAAFERENKPGVVSGFRYDSWYPGYETQAVDGHNIVSILTETNLYRFATPHLYTRRGLPGAVPRLPALGVLPEPVEGRLVAPWRRGGVQPDGLEGRPAHGGRLPRADCSTTSTAPAPT